jgi:hypothetical protein
MEKCVSCRKLFEPFKMGLINGDLVCARCIIDKKMVRAA